MDDLLIPLVAGIEVILLGSETILEWLSDTELLGASLYSWFLGYLVLDTILSLFIQVRYDELDETDDSFDELEDKLNDPYFLEDDTAFNEFFNQLSDPQIKALALKKRKQVFEITKGIKKSAENLVNSFIDTLDRDDEFDGGEQA